jgi:hypothetical protein
MIVHGLAFTLECAPGLNALAELKDHMAAWKAVKEAERTPEREYCWSDPSTEVENKRGRVWEFFMRENTLRDADWTTRVRATQASGDPSTVLVAVTLEYVSLDRRLTPTSHYHTSPRFVQDLAQRFTVRMGHTVATDKPLVVDTEDEVGALIDELASLERSMPLVLVGQSMELGAAHAERPATLARFLFLLANVVALTPSATAHFLRRVKKDWACLEDEVRIFWPSWDPSDSPTKHPRYTADNLESWARQSPEQPDQFLKSQLIRRLHAAARGRYVEPECITAVMRLHEALQATEDLGKDAQVLRQWFEERLELRGQVDRLSREFAAAEDHRKRLERELVEKERELEELRALMGVAPGRRSGPLTVTEALARGRDEFSATLIVPETLVVEADLTGERVMALLHALHELCVLERRDEILHRGELVRSVLKAEAGLDAVYSCGAAGVWGTFPDTGEHVELDEQAVLTSVNDAGEAQRHAALHWCTVGEQPRAVRYLVGRITN